MTIIVTGGAGFIGSHTVKKLLEQKQKVICIDDFNAFYNPKFKEENIKRFTKNKNFTLHKVDICNIEKLEKIFQKSKIDTIIHLAARAGVRPSIQDPLLYYKVNTLGTVNLLELTKKYNIKNFIFSSSSSIYGNNKKIPFSENDNVDNPISPYAATKKSGELACHVYHELHNINVICLRFFTVYGPNGRPDMAPYKFTKLILEEKEIPMYGDGNTYRDYTYVDDIVSGIISSFNYLKRNNDVYEIINLGNSDTVKLSYFIKIIEKETGKTAKIKQMPMQLGDVNKTYADLTKAKKLLKYNPKTRIEEGMANFIKWYLSCRKNIKNNRG